MKSPLDTSQLMATCRHAADAAFRQSLPPPRHFLRHCALSQLAVACRSRRLILRRHLCTPCGAFTRCWLPLMMMLIIFAATHTSRLRHWYCRCRYITYWYYAYCRQPPLPPRHEMPIFITLRAHFTFDYVLSYSIMMAMPKGIIFSYSCFHYATLFFFEVFLHAISFAYFSCILYTLCRDIIFSSQRCFADRCYQIFTLVFSQSFSGIAFIYDYLIRYCSRYCFRHYAMRCSLRALERPLARQAAPPYFFAITLRHILRLSQAYQIYIVAYDLHWHCHNAAVVSCAIEMHIFMMIN